MTSYTQSIANSKISLRSQEIVDTASRISKTNLYQSMGALGDIQDDEIMTKCWGAFGLYISRQMRMGRGIVIPHFGTFSFSAPQVSLDGVTNPDIRDKQFRRPVFLVNKDFVKGKDLRTGIYIDNHMRPFVNQTSGSIQQTKINWAEIASYIFFQNFTYAGQGKDATKFAIERMIRVMSDRCRKDQQVDMQIPGVGNLHSKGNLVAINFNSNFEQVIKGIPKRPLSERKKGGNMQLTAESLSALNFGSTLRKNQPLQLDETAQQYLQQNLDIQDQDIFSQKSFYSRPQTAAARSSMNVSKQQKSLLQRSIGAPQLIRPETMGNLQTVQKTVSDLEQGKKMLTFWKRQNRLNAEDAFLECCNNAFGRTKDRKIKMNLQQFGVACYNMELGLNEIQVAELFNYLDQNQDGFVNYFDWIKVIKDDGQHLHYIRDSVFKNHLHADDVLKTMGFHREHPPINLKQLKQGLLNLDLILDSPSAEKAALEILKGRANVPMAELINIFDCIEEDDKIYDESWFKDILFKIKEKMVSSGNYQGIKKLFEEYDEYNIGSLQTQEFKKCLMKSYLKLSVIDINRIVRYLPKVRGNQIDFYQFLRQVDRIDVVTTSNEQVGDIYEFAEKLAKFLKDNKETIQQFLKIIRRWALQANYESVGEEGQVTVDQVTEYLVRNIFKQTQRYDLERYVKELDIDCDGYILDNDVKTFLEKYNYFEQVYFAPNEATRDLQKNKDYTSQNISLNTKGLFPTDALPEAKIDKVLRDIRKQLEIKNINFPKFFSMLDQDKDGFITIQEFSDNIEKVISLSQFIKDGVFAYMDKLHIGMVDLKFFLKFMQKSVTYPEEQLKKDSYDWQYDMIMKIREWFAHEKLTVEDAFKTLDKHYTGEIREPDLYEFLKEQIKIKEEELTTAKVNRLFKLMDQFKTGRVNCQDFRRFLCEDFSQGFHQTIMGHQTIDNFSSFDWKLNARQQVGVVLTRRFKDLQHSYYIISGYQKKLLFNQFKTWVNSTNCLRGFNISDTQLQEFFADLDTHKKGFLTESDWVNAFKGFDWKRQMIEELKEVLNSNFENMKKAFEFFIQGNRLQMLDYNTFKKSMNYLLPRRFIDSDILDIWLILSQGQKTVGFKNFEALFDRKYGIYNEAYLDVSHKPAHLGSLETTNKSLKDIKDQTVITLDAPFQKESLLDRLRRFLRASNKQLDIELEKADKDKTGILTNLQFRNVIKSMNFGLSWDEIDQLIGLCSLEGNINWQDFLRMIRFRDSDNRIIDRAKIRLQHLTQLIYAYMLSPKDAFRIFDKESKGTIDFDQFQAFIQQISYLAGDQMPPYPIIKDLFDFLDKKRDGVLDLTEWMDVFSQYDYVPITSVPKNPMIQTQVDRPSSEQVPQREKVNKITQSHRRRPQTSYNVKKVNFNQNKHEPCLLREPIIENPVEQALESMGTWESSKEFDKVLAAIGRNRKFLLDMFTQISQTQILTYNVVKSVMEQMLRNAGVDVREEAWPVLIKFAEKDGVVDYKFLLEVYKERIRRIDSHPIGK